MSIALTGIVTGAAMALAARVMSGEVEVPPGAKESLGSARKKIELLGHLMGNFDASKPSTWSDFASRLLDASVDPNRRFANAAKARAWLDLEAPVSLPDLLTRRLMMFEGWARVYEGEQEIVEVFCLTDHIPLAAQYAHQERARPKLFTDKRGITELAALLARAGELFWEGRGAIRIEQHGESLLDRSVPLEGFVYMGENLALIDQWREFLARGIRRNILLQGPPGCGKTTMCHHAARELSDRTLLVDASVMTDLRPGDWFELLEVTRPEVLIIDDIDREGHNLGKYLRLLEEGHCQVPLVLMTSNAHSRLPEALRRPGRIDQIIRFEEPDQHVREAILRQMAREVGVQLPEERMPWLLALHEEYSAAHALEAMRRAKILGWARTEREGDVSFLLQRDFDRASDWLTAHGYTAFKLENTFILSELTRRAPPTLAYADGKEDHLELALPGGASLIFEGEDHRGYGRDVYARDGEEGFARTRAGLAELFWRGRSGVLLDAVDRGEIVARELDLGEVCYHGQMLEHLPRWEAFMEAKMRRVILCQGVPGSGKSTFCLHAVRELSERTLMLTPDAYDEFSCSEWRELLDLLRPTAIIVDDIDRVGSHALEARLRFFEEGYCEVPLVLFTSNDHTELPRAMRRPGRIDQILLFEAPGEELIDDLIDELAARVDVEVPEKHRGKVAALMREHSNAFAVELMRRGKVCGWDNLEHEGDITFTLGQEEGDDDGKVRHFPGRRRRRW